MQTFTTIVIALAIAASAPLQTASQDKWSTELVFESSERYAEPIPKLVPVVVPGGRLLVTVGSTIKMVGRDGKVIWSYSSSDMLTASPAFRADLNEIAIVNSVLEFVRLNADTGRVVYQFGANGSSTYTDIQLYDQGYLVVQDNSGYRQRAEASGLAPGPDSLIYWGNTGDSIWRIDFPTGAKLLVGGDRIYAVTYEERAVRIQEIFPPATK